MDERTFIRDVARSLRCDEPRAEAVACVVLQALRNRLTPKEASDVAAQMPTGLKRMWNEGESAKRPVERIHRAEFIGHIRQRAVLPDDAEATRGAKAVFGALQRLLGSPTGTEGEAWDIYSQLPKDLKNLWLASSEHPL
jgi:uncharacterized protein (DUF2267 family)